MDNNGPPVDISARKDDFAGGTKRARQASGCIYQGGERFFRRSGPQGRNASLRIPVAVRTSKPNFEAGLRFYPRPSLWYKTLGNP